MKINFIGSFTTGYVGELADEGHLARELEELGHHVQRVPRDVWKAICDGLWEEQWEKEKPMTDADINIICKWPHFNDGKYITELRAKTNAPVLYWTWDYMDWPDTGDWHHTMCATADVHLTNEGGDLAKIKAMGVNGYYFPFDVSDKGIDRYAFPIEKKYEVAFFGSYVQKGHRLEYLRYIKDLVPLKIFSWNYQEWVKEGFVAEPAVYGYDFSRKVAQTRICVGMSVEANCWGYWSNRIAKTITTGGFMLQEYAPGMELAFGDAIAYFSSKEELAEQIDYYLLAHSERDIIANRGYKLGRKRFTSEARMRDLTVFMERYLQGRKHEAVISKGMGS